MNRIAVLVFVASLAGQQPDAHLAAARRAETSGDFAAAELEYEKALAVHPDATTYQRLGLVCHLQNRFAEAIPAFRSSLKLQPNQWAARLFLGMDLYRTNQFASALTELNSADRLKPGDLEIRFWLGVTHLALKQYFPGLKILETLSREQPKNLQILRILAENYAAFSATLLNEVAEKYPDTPAGMLVHGQALEFEGADEAALEIYRMLNLKWPDRPGVREAIDRLKGRSSSRPRPSPEAAADASAFPL
ncbi:MAG: domain protein putative component of TonB system [Bryobacterales bacterium]|nr:domain protein putative component of TonB system [Bryobacterales bacterium]